MKTPTAAGLARGAGVLVLCCAAHASVGAITYVSQARSVTAETSADANVLTIAATDFARFARTASLATTFVAADSTTQPNTADAGIDCQLDPNAIRASGTLASAGGLSVLGVPVVGEAGAQVEVTFTIAELTPIRIVASPRPSSDPRDRWVVKLSDANNDLFAIDETMPAQSVDFSTVLPAGQYVFEFQVEYSTASAGSNATFYVEALVPAPGAMGLMAGLGVVGLRRRRRERCGA